MRIVKGGLQVADQSTALRLRERKYGMGDLVFVEIKKVRNPGFHSLAHQLGTLVRENIPGFEHLESHQVLKRLQIESGVGCDEVGIQFPGIGPCTYRVPQSLSYESMDQGEFKAVIAGLCRYVATTYWPGLSPEQIENMASCMVGEGV